MGRSRTITALALGFASFLWIAPPARAADHKDAPAIFGTPFVDVNDVYLFRNPADSSKLVVILTTHPLLEPEFAQTFPYQVNTVHRFQFSNSGNGVPTANLDFEFSGSAGSQTFTANFFSGPSNARVLLHTFTGAVTAGTVLSSNPNPPIVVEPPGTGIKATVGPFDDPFFFDAVGFNRLLALLRGQTIERPKKPFRGIGSFTGFNINAIVVEFPIAKVMGASPRIDAWGVLYSIIDTSLTGPARNADSNLRQIDRMGNPAINTALIGIIPCGTSFPCRGTTPTLGAQKNAFNLGLPQNDAADYGAEIVTTLKTFYGTSDANIAILGAVGLPDTLKLDTRAPDGFPNGRRPQDDAIDVELNLISNGTIPTDGTNKNDVAGGKYPKVFPYLLPAQQAPQKHSDDNDR